jgi:hypothetical protein
MIQTTATMTEPPTPAQTQRGQTVRELHELVAALDRRVPHIERAGEVSIACAAAALRVEALQRIQELEGDAVGIEPNYS